ncbi:MAG: dihydroneopterin aldolase [Oscillospiraceae bacterium]|nr:dihydroneopterin aldolase [Oscillospiraceae bacterium]
MDKIIIKDLKIFAYHGVNTEEKAKGQNFEIDITTDIDLSKPCATDDINDTVSYAKIIKLASAVFTAEKYNLLEKAAEAVAEAVLSEFEAIKKVKILLKKPEAPIQADFSYAAVEIARKRG